MFKHALNADSHLALLELRHAAELFALADRNRERLRQWMGWVDRTREVKDIEEFIKLSLKEFAEREGMVAGIFHQGRLAGVTGFHNLDCENKKTSTGYWIGAEFEGKGLVTAACRALVDHAFNDLGLNRVEILCAVGNARSAAVPKRLGFQFEGVRRGNECLYGRFVDHESYAVLSTDWPKKQTV